MSDLHDLQLPNGRVIPARHLSVRTALSGGPGGQHVNKTETKVDLRLDLSACANIFTPTQFARLQAKLKNDMDSDGRIQVICQTHRSQLRNIEEAQEKMVTLLVEALKVPRKRRPTKPTRGSKKRRLDGKTKHGKLKKDRGWKPD